MAERIPPEERLTSLVVALMATDIGLTKQQIFESVSGYRHALKGNTATPALEKMFERDKDELRGLGIPLETLGDHADPNDLREARYRIPQSEYDLPEGIEFTPSEVALLTLAATVWRDGSLSRASQSGLRKIRSLGIDVDEPIIGFAPRLGFAPASFSDVQQAIESATTIQFSYLKPGESAPMLRTVQPLALIDLEARWHLVGVDVDRGAERTFLLSRIVGDVTNTGDAFDPALRAGAGERGLQDLTALLTRNRAIVDVGAGTEASLRLARRATTVGEHMEVRYLDEAIFADELASYGPEVHVIGPSSLRAAVIDRLRAAVALHEGVPHGH